MCTGSGSVPSPKGRLVYRVLRGFFCNAREAKAGTGYPLLFTSGAQHF